MFAVCRSTEEESGRIDPPNPIKRGRRRASSLAYRSLMNAIFSRKNPAHLHTGVGGGVKKLLFLGIVRHRPKVNGAFPLSTVFFFNGLGTGFYRVFGEKAASRRPFFFVCRCCCCCCCSCGRSN